MKSIITIFLLVLCPLLSRAQEIPSLVFSGGKGIIGKKVLQFEYGPNFERQFSEFDSLQQGFAQYFLIKYGVSNKVQLSASYNRSNQQVFVSDQVRRSNGTSNFTAGLKRSINKNFSLKSDVGFKRGTNGKALMSLQFLGITEHSLDSIITWENNLGLSWSFDSPRTNLVYLSGLTFGFPRPIDIIVETYGQYSGGSLSHYYNIGTGLYFSRDLMVEVYSGIGVTALDESYFFSFNFFYRIPLGPV